MELSAEAQGFVAAGRELRVEPPKHSEGDGPHAAVPAEVIVEEMQRARGGLRALGLQLVLPKCAEALDLVSAAADAEHGRNVVKDFRQARRELSSRRTGGIICALKYGSEPGRKKSSSAVLGARCSLAFK